MIRSLFVYGVERDRCTVVRVTCPEAGELAIIRNKTLGRTSGFVDRKPITEDDMRKRVKAQGWWLELLDGVGQPDDRTPKPQGSQK